MTQERLRELLRERVAEERMPDWSTQAWQRARVVRRRRRLGVAAGVVAGTVAVSVGVAAVNSTPVSDPREPGMSDVQTSEPVAEPDATYRGTPVWWSPDQREERELAPIDSPFPAEIDLDASTPYVAGELDHAIAAFARGREVVLLGAEGQLRTVDVSSVEKFTKPNGYWYFPASEWMLSRDGDRLIFPQDDEDKVFSIPDATWSTVPKGTGLTKQRPPVPPFDASAAQQYGAAHNGAASWGMGVAGLPVRDSGEYLSGPEFLVAEADQMVMLAFMDRFSDGQDSRWKNCCPVAGWLDRDWVVYESRQSTPLLVAWRVGTGEFRLVSRILGQYDVASFA
ncbi:MAG TPA: hypothetical protein DEQ43_27500 [Nocardioides bacterium]|uniref:hypothetical protein n=1 Tax=uncultured Nocardioides sp. TaxID=198441 RepID=UPI000ED93F2F|nr:hypothetical protein [uncultured Nocardioides sp.]HCB07957.1 hypothetical protein [Nocardioides sp.]